MSFAVGAELLPPPQPAKTAIASIMLRTRLIRPTHSSRRSAPCGRHHHSARQGMQRSCDERSGRLKQSPCPRNFIYINQEVEYIDALQEGSAGRNSSRPPDNPRDRVLGLSRKWLISLDSEAVAEDRQMALLGALPAPRRLNR